MNCEQAIEQSPIGLAQRSSDGAIAKDLGGGDCGFIVPDGCTEESTDERFFCDDWQPVGVLGGVAERARSNSSVDDLRFSGFAIANRRRCEEAFHALVEWSPAEWGCALAGEAGETCNLIKKMLRGEDIEVDAIGRELADVVTYADLLAQRLGLSLAECVARKFDEVSIRVGSEVFLLE